MEPEQKCRPQDAMPDPTVYLYADDDATPWLERGCRVWRSPLKRPAERLDTPTP